MTRSFLGVSLWLWLVAAGALLWLGHKTGNCILCNRLAAADDAAELL